MLAESQDFMRKYTPATVSFRDLKRFLKVFQWLLLNTSYRSRGPLKRPENMSIETSEEGLSDLPAMGMNGREYVAATRFLLDLFGCTIFSDPRVMNVHVQS